MTEKRFRGNEAFSMKKKKSRAKMPGFFHEPKPLTYHQYQPG
jgi:hypothetical protein